MRAQEFGHTRRPLPREPLDRIAGDRQPPLRAGAGIGIPPNFFADSDVAAGLLVRVLPRWSIRSGALWLLCAGSRHLPRKVTAFRESVIEALRTSPFVAGA